jgi:hypothetical protein
MIGAGAGFPDPQAGAVLLKGSINMQQQAPVIERPTFALKLYLDAPAYAKEEVLAGLERAAETIRTFGLVETDRIRDTGGRVLGSYRSYRL